MSADFRFLDVAARDEFILTHLTMASHPKTISYELAKRVRDKEPMIIERIGVEIHTPTAVFCGVLEWFEISDGGTTILHFVGGRTIRVSVLSS